MSLLIALSVIALVALIPCFVLFRFLDKNYARAHGGVRSAKVVVGGPLAAYVVLFCIILYELLPLVRTDPNAINITSDWNISFQPAGEAEASLKGVASIYQDGENMSFSGLLHPVQGVPHQIISNYGQVIRNGRNFISLFEIPGDSSKTRGVIRGSLPRGEQNELIADYHLLNGIDVFDGPFGYVVFERVDYQPPWLVTLIILVLFPLLIAWIIWKYLPRSKAKVSGSFFGIKYRLGGAMAAYGSVLFLLIAAFEILSAPSAFSKPHLSEKTDFNICGTWRYANYPFEKEGVEGVGIALIQQTGTKITINGGLDENSLYPSAPWNSRFGAVSVDGEVMFYFEVQGGDGSTGIEYGSLLSKTPDEFTLEWNDLQLSWSSNRGRTVFKREKPCE